MNFLLGSPKDNQSNFSDKTSEKQYTELNSRANQRPKLKNKCQLADVFHEFIKNQRNHSNPISTYFSITLSPTYEDLILKLPVIVSPHQETAKLFSKQQPFITFRNVLLSERKEIKELQDEEILPFYENDGMIGEIKRLELDAEGKKRTIKKKLHFNKKQEAIFLENYENDNKKFREEFQKTLRHDQFTKKMMPKIKIYSSRNQKPDTKTPEEEAKDIEKKKFSTLANLKNCLIKDIKVFWYAPIEKVNWHPEMREGGAFAILGRYGYLYGGLSKGLLNEMEVIDTGTYLYV